MRSLARRRLRAPQDDGAALIDPPLSAAPALLAANRAKSARWDDESGVPFSKWRSLARADLLEICDAQVRAKPELFANHSPATLDRPFVLSGHQPTLFHPGVWLKNFLLSALAERYNANAINLIIDSDIVSAPGIAVPTRIAGEASVAQVPIDVSDEATPWEWRPVRNRELFRTFSRRVKEAFSFDDASRGSLLLSPFWDHAIHAQETELEMWGWIGPRLMSLGECLASARHRLELEIGLRTYEAPLHLLVGQPFRQFADHLFSRAAELREVYNRALFEYRAINHVRSQSHPVPELETDGEWIEVPFWLWTVDSPRRKRAFVRNSAAGCELTDREGLILPLGWQSPDAAHRDKSPRLRPRALVTTMYARLVLSDLFIHGIGGAKYDELTDLIIRRFFGIEPPAYVTATATFRLPIERPNVSLDDVRHSAQRLRELRFRPESFLGDARVKQDAELAQKLAAFAAEKSEYLARHDLRRCSQDVFNRLDAMNRAMRDLLRDVEEESRARHAELVVRARQSQLLSSREFSFVLFPSEKLPARLLELSTGIA